MKSIKDYLHLYLGCEVWHKEKLWDLVGVSRPYKTNNETFVNIDLRPEGKGYRSISYVSESFTDLSKIKLILRPLSDITDEEKKEVYHLDDHALHELGGDGTGYALPYVFTWCLSKHFDLFGLIESGLAIDATTINKPQVTNP